MLALQEQHGGGCILVQFIGDFSRPSQGIPIMVSFFNRHQDWVDIARKMHSHFVGVIAPWLDLDNLIESASCKRWSAGPGATRVSGNSYNSDSGHRVLPTAASVPTSFGHPTCAACGAQGNLKFCGGCGCVKYCSKACSISDWQHHRVVCKFLSVKEPTPMKPHAQ